MHGFVCEVIGYHNTKYSYGVPVASEPRSGYFHNKDFYEGNSILMGPSLQCQICIGESANEQSHICHMTQQCAAHFYGENNLHEMYRLKVL